MASTGEELDEENAGSVHRYHWLLIHTYSIYIHISPIGCQIIIYQCSFSSHDADDEFVSESYQGATKKEMAEVNESMRRLGLGGGGGKSNTNFH